MNNVETVTITLDRYESMKAEIEQLEEENERFMSCFDSQRLGDGSIKIDINAEELTKFLSAKFIHPIPLAFQDFVNLGSKINPLVFIKK